MQLTKKTQNTHT